MPIKCLRAGIPFILAGMAITSPALAASSGRIFGNGALAAGSTGIKTVTHPATGQYCILPSAPVVQAKQAAGKLFPQLTFNFVGSGGFIVIVSAFGGITCPSPSWIQVRAQTADNTNPIFHLDEDASFNIAF